MCESKKISTEKSFFLDIYQQQNCKNTDTNKNKPVYLGLSILEVTKIVMYEFWYDYVKQKYGQRMKLCYMKTVSLYNKKQMIFIKTFQKMLKKSLLLQILN